MSVVHRSDPLCSRSRWLGSFVQGEVALGLTPGPEAPGGHLQVCPLGGSWASSPGGQGLRGGGC